MLAHYPFVAVGLVAKFGRTGGVTLQCWPRLVAVLVLVAVSAAAIPAEAQRTPGLDETRERLQKLVTQLSDAETALGSLEQEISIAEAETGRLETEVALVLDEASAAAISDFIDGDPEVGLLATDNPIVSLRAATLNELAVGSNIDSLELYRVLLEDLDVSEAALAAATIAQEELLAELVSTRDEIGVELARLEEIEAKRLAEERRKEEERRQAEARRKAEERRKAAEAAAAQPSSSGGSGGSDSGGSGSGDSDSGTSSAAPSAGTVLTYCPVAGAVSFIDSWGYARSGGRRHKGVDMMASIGTPIAAPVSGTVSHRSNRVGGRSFHLQGNDGNYYYGTHLSDYGASGSVNAGDIIGYVGDDGNARGIPHLHFEVHPGGGRAVNPYPYVNAVC